MVQYIETAAGDEGNVDLARDRALVLRCQSGDPAAFAALYTRYEARLLRFCQRRLRDRPEAEDVTQEAFVRAWRAMPRFAGDRRFYPWLTVIAANLCTDALRHRSHTAPEVDVELESTTAHLVDRQETTEEQIVAVVDGELVRRALGRLTVRHRRVLALREGSEWSYKDIARFEGVEVSAIETLVWRARQALKREFDAVSGSAPSLGAALCIGAGITRRFRIAAARHCVLVRPSGHRLRDAAMALMVTSAVATSAAVTLSVPTSEATPSAGSVRPGLAVDPGSPGSTVVPGRAAAQLRTVVEVPSVPPAVVGPSAGAIGDPDRQTVTGVPTGGASSDASSAAGIVGATTAAATSGAGVGPRAGTPVAAPTLPIVPVVSAVAPVVTSAATTAGLPVPVPPLLVTGTGVLSTAVHTVSGGASPATSSAPARGLLGTP